MSPKVIKRDTFQALFSPDPEGPTERFSSLAARVEQLERRLEEASRQHERVVEQAVSETRDEMSEQCQEEYGAATATLRSVAAELRALARSELKIVEEEVAALAGAIAGKIVRREIARDDEYVVRLVRRCLRKIVGDAPVTIRVHRDDQARVAEEMPDLAREGSGAPELTVIADRRVERGGCIVDTPDFVVDGRLRTQLGAAQDAIRGDGP